MAKIELTANQWLALSLLLSNALKEIFNKVSEMSEDELQEATRKEEERSNSLMDEVEGH